MTTKIKEVLISPYGQIAVFDHAGNQIPELQTSLMRLWSEHAAKQGFDLDGLRVEFVPGRFKVFFKTEDGYNYRDDTTPETEESDGYYQF